MRGSLGQVGFTLLELLTASVVAILVGLGLLALITATYNSHRSVVNQNYVNAVGRTPVDTLADHLRNAWMPCSGSPCVRTSSSSVFAAASASSVTYYIDDAGSTVRYYRDGSVSPPTLVRVDGSGSSVVMSGLTSLQFTYYTPAYGYSSSTWLTTGNPNAPTPAELPSIGAVQITAVVTSNGLTRPITSFVRLRNSPYKQKN
jgi:hypothetical protein